MESSSPYSRFRLCTAAQGFAILAKTYQFNGNFLTLFFSDLSKTWSPCAFSHSWACELDTSRILLWRLGGCLLSSPSPSVQFSKAPGMRFAARAASLHQWLASGGPFRSSKHLLPCWCFGWDFSYAPRCRIKRARMSHRRLWRRCRCIASSFHCSASSSHSVSR